MAANARSPNVIDAHIGQRIKQRRIEVDMTQTELAEKLGITFQQIQKYEKGINRIGGGRLADIATVFGCEITYFYEGAPGTKLAALPPAKLQIARKRSAAALSSEGTAIIEALAKMRPALRVAMAKIARALAAAE